jgi:hypothetical protein
MHVQGAAILGLVTFASDMANLRVHNALMGVPGLSYRGKALLLAALAVAIQITTAVALASHPATLNGGLSRYVLVGAATVASVALLSAPSTSPLRSGKTAWSSRAAPGRRRTPATRARA